MNTSTKCPFETGDLVRFTPSERTRGHYQNIERFGIAPNEVREVKAIKDDIYLYFEGEVGGWPWNEFELVQRRSRLEGGGPL